MPLIKSWVEAANAPDCDFPLNNLPYGVMSRGDEDEPVCCVAIGDQALDLAALEAAGLLEGICEDPVFDLPFLNEFMETGPEAWAALRARLTDLLREGGDDALAEDPTLQTQAFVPLSSAKMHLPIAVMEYTDFYAGKQHAQNVGEMFRGKENALPPNWLHIPIGYNGRASSVVVSGTGIRRPLGQRKAPDADAPSFGASARLDYELEMGAIVGVGSDGPVTTEQAAKMIFGYVILNDWSSRDIQAWEYQPLGPFQGKAFGTSISPWIVPAAALEDFRTPVPPREVPILPYLEETTPGGLDIALKATLTPEGAEAATTICETNYKVMYWSSAQQLTHHAVCGCPMQVGDVLGSGTISDVPKGSWGSLLEESWGGKTPIELASGGTRTFLEDGDTLTITGHAQGDGFRIGFGACTGTILPAKTGFPA
ncbi:fumarylacetoacetase [Rhodovulum sp. DZ06]|uniref:fumarylacetoacetase n=1 Tax=Rhodovulum sp. DZ06 TaxID=3425126 RepID=UPI003D35912F